MVTDEAGTEVERLEAKAAVRRQAAQLPLPVPPREKRGDLLQGAPPPPRRLRLAPAPPRREQTLANNSRLVVVDQGGGPYRVLVRERPSQLGVQVPPPGRQRGRAGAARRPLADRPAAAQVRLSRPRGTGPSPSSTTASTTPTPTPPNAPISPCSSAWEHATTSRASRRVPQDRRRAVQVPRGRDRRPRSRFFTPDQLALLRNFVSVRGGGLLMLGGPDAFVDGKYDRTPVGDLLPVYLNKAAGRAGRTRNTAWS